jgi:enterochelin esterase-like enzyme
VAHGKLLTERFVSPALGRQERYLVYLPPGYAADVRSGRRFPVLYLLHGSPGYPILFWHAAQLGTDLDELVARHRIRPFLVVAPSGQDGSFSDDTEWADTAHGRYAALVLETVHAVDRRWATVTSRRYRGLGGESEGGYGAMNVGLRNLSRFGVLESWSGYFVQRGDGPFARASESERTANSPLAYVRALAPTLTRLPVHAFIYVGRSDPGLGEARSFAARMRAAGGHVTFAAYPGTHSWQLWRERMPQMLTFASRWFGAPR